MLVKLYAIDTRDINTLDHNFRASSKSPICVLIDPQEEKVVKPVIQRGTQLNWRHSRKYLPSVIARLSHDLVRA